MFFRFVYQVCVQKNYSHERAVDCIMCLLLFRISFVVVVVIIIIIIFFSVGFSLCFFCFVCAYTISVPCWCFVRKLHTYFMRRIISFSFARSYVRRWMPQLCIHIVFTTVVALWLLLFLFFCVFWFSCREQKRKTSSEQAKHHIIVLLFYFLGVYRERKSNAATKRLWKLNIYHLAWLTREKKSNV